MNKKIKGFPRFLQCKASKAEKATALLKWVCCAGTKDVVVNNGVFRITKIGGNHGYSEQL